MLAEAGACDHPTGAPPVEPPCTPGSSFIGVEIEKSGKGRIGLGLQANKNSLVVSSVAPSGIAMKAGLAVGDVIMNIDGMDAKCESMSKHKANALLFDAKKSVRVSVLRMQPLGDAAFASGAALGDKGAKRSREAENVRPPSVSAMARRGTVATVANAGSVSGPVVVGATSSSGAASSKRQRRDAAGQAQSVAKASAGSQSTVGTFAAGPTAAPIVEETPLPLQSAPKAQALLAEGDEGRVASGTAAELAALVNPPGRLAGLKRRIAALANEVGTRQFSAQEVCRAGRERFERVAVTGAAGVLTKVQPCPSLVCLIYRRWRSRTRAPASCFLL